MGRGEWPAADLLARGSAVRLVPVRIAEPRPSALLQALSFVAATPARVVLLPIELDEFDSAVAVAQWAARTPDVTVVVAAGAPARHGDDVPS